LWGNLAVGQSGKTNHLALRSIAEEGPSAAFVRSGAAPLHYDEAMPVSATFIHLLAAAFRTAASRREFTDSFFAL
jgi:hypothetical protein